MGKELNLVGNIFVFPSVSEACSLIQAEAAVTGKLLVLNTNFLPMLEFTRGHVLHFPMTHNSAGNRAFWRSLARELVQEMDAIPGFWTSTEARTSFYNEDRIFVRQIEPLLWRRNEELAERVTSDGSPVV